MLFTTYFGARCNGIDASGKGLYSCAAHFCTTINDGPTCDISNEPTIDDQGMQKRLDEMKCSNTCREDRVSLDPRCSRAVLKQYVKFHSVKAAWCNDNYLVVVSDGGPGYEHVLGTNPMPPVCC